MKYRSEVDIKALVVQAEKDLSVSSAEACKAFLLAISVQIAAMINLAVMTYGRLGAAFNNARIERNATHIAEISNMSPLHEVWRRRTWESRVERVFDLIR